MKVDAEVHIGVPDNGKPFGLAVDLHVASPSGGIGEAELRKLVEKAHEVSPAFRSVLWAARDPFGKTDD